MRERTRPIGWNYQHIRAWINKQSILLLKTRICSIWHMTYIQMKKITDSQGWGKQATAHPFTYASFCTLIFLLKTRYQFLPISFLVESSSCKNYSIIYCKFGASIMDNVNFFFFFDCCLWLSIVVSCQSPYYFTLHSWREVPWHWLLYTVLRSSVLDDPSWSLIVEIWNFQQVRWCSRRHMRDKERHKW